MLQNFHNFHHNQWRQIVVLKQQTWPMTSFRSGGFFAEKQKLERAAACKRRFSAQILFGCLPKEWCLFTPCFLPLFVRIFLAIEQVTFIFFSTSTCYVYVYFCWSAVNCALEFRLTSLEKVNLNVFTQILSVSFKKCSVFTRISSSIIKIKRFYSNFKCYL